MPSWASLTSSSEPWQHTPCLSVGFLPSPLPVLCSLGTGSYFKRETFEESDSLSMCFSCLQERFSVVMTASPTLSPGTDPHSQNKPCSPTSRLLSWLLHCLAYSHCSLKSASSEGPLLSPQSTDDCAHCLWITSMSHHGRLFYAGSRDGAQVLMCVRKAFIDYAITPDPK